MALTLQILVSIVFLSLFSNVASKVNVAVTLNQKDAFTMFTADELWGFEYVNQSAGIVQVNVVLDESKYKSIQQMNTSKYDHNTIYGIDMIYSNVEQIIEKEYYRLTHNKSRFEKGNALNIFFNDYRDWIEYEIFLEEFLLLNENIASQSTLGTTVQGRSIPLITLSTGDESNKPGFYIQAALHAREWLANAATTFIMNALAEGYQNGDETITEILENVNIYIAPTVNIDGYIYSWTTDRQWRKNRRNNGGNIFGVDLNRNYEAPDNQWCQIGASSDPSSGTYCGPSFLSEPETVATADFIRDSANNIQAAFDMHTFGPLILWPWGYTV